MFLPAIGSVISAKLFFEAELERDVLDAVAVVVDVNLVQRVGIEREVIGTAVRILQRNVVATSVTNASRPGSYERNM